MACTLYVINRAATDIRFVHLNDPHTHTCTNHLPENIHLQLLLDYITFNFETVKYTWKHCVVLARTGNCVWLSSADLYCPSGCSGLCCPSGCSDLYCPNGCSDLYCPSGCSDLCCPSGCSDLYCPSGCSDLYCPSGCSDLSPFSTHFAVC